MPLAATNTWKFIIVQLEDSAHYKVPGIFLASHHLLPSSPASEDHDTPHLLLKVILWLNKISVIGYSIEKVTP